MTQYYQTWGRLSKKIISIHEVSIACSNMLESNSSDGYDSMKTIAISANHCFQNIKKYINDFKQHLPKVVLPIFESFVSINEESFRSMLGDTDKNLRNQLTISMIIKLRLFEAEVSYILKDNQEYIRKSVEIAFAHLQRQIVVDEYVRSNWQNNWNVKKKEDHFEALGGVHFLAHKIWAFKAESARETTDLVLKEHINVEDPLYQSVEGLVLTEWKKVQDPKKALNKIKEAKTQASKYKSGSLSSLELSNYCYLVMVSKDILKIEQPLFEEDGTTYRVINITCFPKTPSGKPIKKK